MNRAKKLSRSGRIALVVGTLPRSFLPERLGVGTLRRSFLPERLVVAAVATLAVSLWYTAPAGAQPAGETSGETRPAEVSSAKQAYSRARSLFQQGSYTEALAVIDAGLVLAAQDLRLLSLRGAVLLEKRDYEGALAAYEAYLAAGPRGGDRRKAQKIVDNLEVVRNTFLKVVVDAGLGRGPATVYLEDKRLGVFCVADPECTRGTVPRATRVLIERDGFEPRRERVAVDPNTVAEVVVTLTEKPSQFDIEVSPTDAEVTLDGKVLGSGTQSLEVAAGDHALVVALDGFVRHEETVAAHAGKPVKVSVTLQEAILVTIAGPSDASAVSFTLDGKPVKVTGGVLPITGGAHTLVARARGYADTTIAIPDKRWRGYQVDVAMKESKPLPGPSTPGPQVDTGAAPSGQWPLAKKVAVAGLGALAAVEYVATTVLAARASSRWSEAKDVCQTAIRDGLVCAPDLVKPGQEANDAARGANITFAAGTVAAIGVLAAWNWRQPAPESGRFTLRRKISLGATTAVAVGALGIANLYRIRSGSRRDDADKPCEPGEMLCEQQRLVDDAKASEYSKTATVGFVMAAAAAGGAVYLWLSAPGERSPGDRRASQRRPLEFTPVVSSQAAGILLRGGF